MAFTAINSMKMKRKPSLFLMDVALYPAPHFYLALWDWFFLTKVGGNGGSILLNNGNDTTAFAKPDRTVTSYNTTLNFGAVRSKSELHNSIRAFLFNLFDSRARAISYLLAVNYYMD